MKLITIAAALLVIVCAFAVFNVYYMGGLIGGLIDELDSARSVAEQGDFTSAADLAERAAETWRSKEFYTNIAMRHNEVDQTTALFYDLLGSLYAEEAGAAHGNFEKLRARLTCLRSLESVSFGSVF